MGASLDTLKHRAFDRTVNSRFVGKPEVIRLFPA